MGKMAGATGLEPAASGVTGRRYNQLNYAPARATECYFYPSGEMNVPWDNSKVNGRFEKICHSLSIFLLCRNPLEILIFVAGFYGDPVTFCRPLGGIMGLASIATKGPRWIL